MRERTARRKRTRPPARPTSPAVRGLGPPLEASRATRIALVGACTAVALALRLYRLGHDPLWFDEAYTALTARRPLGDILRLLRTEANAPLYYVLLHGWSAVAGGSDAGLRLLSALTGAAVVPAMYGVGAALFGPATGIVAAALAAVVPLDVHYSRELRMYGLVPPLALGTLYGFDRLVRRPDVRGAAVLAVSLTAGLYVHYFFLFLVPLAVATVWSPEPRRAAAYTAAALAAAALAFSPWIATLAAQAGPTRTLDWIPAWWANGHSLWAAVPWSLMVFGPAGYYPPGWFNLASSAAGGALSLACALGVLAAVGVRLARARDGALRTSLGLTVAATFLPLLAALGASALRSPIYVVARYDMIAWAPYCLLVAAVVAALPRGIALLATAAWVALSVATLVPHFTTDRPILAAANYGHVLAGLLRRRAADGDLVIFTAQTRPTTEYYLGASATRLRMVSHPLGTDDHLGWIDIRIARDPAFAEQEAERLAAWVARLEPAPAHVWLVEPVTPGSAPIVGALQRRGYAVDAQRSDGDVVGLVGP